MISMFLCALGAVGTYLAARRSLLAGLVAVLSVGYLWGIVRANFPGILTYFLFDFAVIAFYIGVLQSSLGRAKRIRFRPLLPWIVLFFGWTFVILLLQMQDPLVQFVGLRAHLFFLPFLLVGAMLLPAEMYRLALWLGAFNLVAFAFGVAEFFLGVERFFPYEEGITTLIYRSTDLADFAFRIPATFGNAHLYGGTMVITLPILLGAWVQEHRHRWQGQFLTMAIAASVLGIFMAAARINMLLLMIVVMVTIFSGALSGRMRVSAQIGWVLMLAGVGWIVSTDVRLQRFTTLTSDRFLERLSWSVNHNLWDGMLSYPLGNGLGGGGTNMPFFLQGLIRNLIVMENEYARIAFELGLPGLLLWLGFLIWVFTRATTHRAEPWFLGRRLAWFVCLGFFGAALIGLGLLAAVPQALLLFICVGWIAVRQPMERRPRATHRVAERATAPASTPLHV